MRPSQTTTPRAATHQPPREASVPGGLANADAQRQAILDNIPDQAWLKDEHSRYVAVNEAYIEACGVVEQKILGRRPPDVWPRAIAEQYLATDHDVLTSGESRRYEEKRKDRSGQLRSFETIKTPVRAADGSIIGTVGISRDITHYKEVERELREQRARSRELSTHLQSVREQEQARISRELHDELGQNLSALHLGLDWIEAKLPPGQVEITEKLAALRGVVEDTLTAMETIATELRPAVLDDLGLVAAAEYLVNSTRERSGLAIARTIKLGESAIDHETSTAIFRILQEALTNVVRHAKARNVAVSLTRSYGVVVLQVRDDGCGLPREPAFATMPRLGLLGMQERARMIGGELTIESAPGAGTELMLRVSAATLREKASHTA